MARCKIHKKDRERFVKLCNQLNDLIECIHEYNPETCIFVSGEGTTDINLMSVDLDTLVGRDSTGQYNDEIVESVSINHCDCGGW